MASTPSLAAAWDRLAADGSATHLPLDLLSVEVTDHWTSPRTQARYPSGWRITIPSRQLILQVTPNLADQELETPATTGVTYWEGSVAVTGTADGKPVAGAGYVELTGYSKSEAPPL